MLASSEMEWPSAFTSGTLTVPTLRVEAMRMSASVGHRVRCSVPVPPEASDPGARTT